MGNKQFSTQGISVDNGAWIGEFVETREGVEVGVFVVDNGGVRDGLMSITVKIAAMTIAACKAYRVVRYRLVQGALRIRL